MELYPPTEIYVVLTIAVALVSIMALSHRALVQRFEEPITLILLLAWLPLGIHYLFLAIAAFANIERYLPHTSPFDVIISVFHAVVLFSIPWLIVKTVDAVTDTSSN